MTNEERARAQIAFLMRQADGGYYPQRIPHRPPLSDWVDATTAQKIYDEEIARVEALSGPLPRWDEDRNAPVPGTPEP